MLRLSKILSLLFLGLSVLFFSNNAMAFADAISGVGGTGPSTFSFDDGPAASRYQIASCPEGDSCPDIEPLPENEARELAGVINARPKSDRVERGAQRVEDKSTGERRNVTGNEAGRGSPRSFRFRKPPEGTTRVATVHSHPCREYEKHEHASGNAPSEDDQKVLHISKRPVLTVGPDVTTQLYRRDGQDYLQVIDGDESELPSEEELAEQGIVLCSKGDEC